MDEWTVVRNKRRSSGSSRSRGHHVHSSRPELQKKPSPELAIKADNALGENHEEKGEEERLVGKLERAISKVEQSSFFTRFMRQLQDLEVVESLSRSCNFRSSAEVEEVSTEECANEESTVELVVYGVGSIAISEISRCQLALALLLKRRLAAVLGSISVFDPIMTSIERSVMRTLGCVPLNDNQEGRRALQGPSLFYMPHCDVELYESVLQTNLKPDNVRQLVILGNSFRAYRDRWSVCPLPQGERPSCLLKVQESVEEFPVADNFSPTAFNDTSWHFFSKVKVSELS